MKTEGSQNRVNKCKRREGYRERDTGGDEGIRDRDRCRASHGNS